MRFRESDRAGASVVVGAGWIADKPGTTQGRDYRAHALVYLTAGGGWYEDERCPRRAVAAGDLLVLFPGLRHGYGPETPGGWTEAWVGFRGPVFAALEAEGIIARDRPVLHPGLDEGLIARFDGIIAAVDRRSGVADPVLAARVHLLVAELAAAEAAPTPTGLVARARAALEADLRAPIDLPALAARFGVGYDALRRAFRAELGTTPGRWRLLRRIERAKELLVAGRTLDAIAGELGFCDRFFLARQFRQVVGVPPGRWRVETLGR